MIMKALIFTGGEGPSPGFLKKLASSADFIVAADSGLDLAMGAGISPNLVLGDFDSISDRAVLNDLKNAQVIEFEAAKDATDTELAIYESRRRGYDQIVLCGGGGGRIDHLFAIFELFKRKSRPLEWYTKSESIHLVPQNRTAEFNVQIGDMVSVFHLGEHSRLMISKGLKWPLRGLEWESGQFGISNIAITASIMVTAGTSDLIVIIPAGIQRA